MTGTRRKRSPAGRLTAGILAACCPLLTEGLSAQEERDGTTRVEAVTEERDRLEQPDRVMMKGGSSFDVLGFEVGDSVLSMVALNGRRWSVRVDLVDLERTRKANGMSSAETRSPGWSRASEPIDEPRDPDVELVALEPSLPELHPVAFAPPEPSKPEPPAAPEPVAYAKEEDRPEAPEGESFSAQAEAKVAHDEGMARARAEYEDAIRSIVRAQERLERRVKELEIAQTAQVEPLPAGPTLQEHSLPEQLLVALTQAEAEHEEAMARAKAEYEEATRAIAKAQERVEQLLKELDVTQAAPPEPLPEGSQEPPIPGQLLEELAKARVDYEQAMARAKVDYEEATRAIARQQERLERRVKELEITRTAQEDATRAIIRDATSTLGSKVNQFVALGGNFEVATGWLKSTSGRSESVLDLSTAEIDFEVQVNDWTLGSLILEYDTGANIFRSTRGSELLVDRINIDTAFLTIGDPLRFPPFGTVGRVILPFGISTGDPVADVLTLEDPLTIEAFEMRETAIWIGAGFPTPPLTPATPPVAPPPVRPLAIQPFFKTISRGLGYKPPPTRPQQPTPVTPPPAPPLLNVDVVVYQGNTFVATEGGLNFGATAGFRKKWDCNRPYDEGDGWHRLSCPWSIDVDVDYSTSVFDSRFLEFEYVGFLDQIGYVPGMATSIKATLGAISVVGEWNGAIADATFFDDSETFIRIRPSAWQVSLAYQFDWNPWVEAIGAQGSYLAASYSESQDLGGVTRSGERVGFLPRRRFSLSAGEWVLDSLRLAVEYSRNADYSLGQGGTGDTADGILVVVTYAW